MRFHAGVIAYPRLTEPTVLGSFETPWASVTATSLTVTARADTDGIEGRLVVSASEDLSHPTYSQTGTVSNGILRCTVTGLTPGTQYYYGIDSDDITATGAAKTAPSTATSFNFAAASCALTGSNHIVFEALKDLAPDFFHHLGDIHYENIATNDPALFRSAYNAVFDSARQSSLYAAVPMTYCWDDHDYGPDNSSASSSSRSASIQAFRERVPFYQQLVEGSGEAVYYSYTYGRALFVVTDLRSEASSNSATDNDSKTMMGAAQKQWFKDTISDEANRDKLIIWFCSRPWNVSSGTDTWAQFSTERTELVNFIATNDLARRMLIVAGDMHAIAIDDGSNSPGGIPILQAAPLDQANSIKGGPYSEGAFDDYSGQFGHVEITDTGTDTIGVNLTGYRVTSQADKTLVPLVTHSFNVDLSIDETAPVLSGANVTPGSTNATIQVATNESGGTLYGVVTSSETEPSVEQVQAGENHAGEAAVASGNQSVSTSGSQSLQVSGLTEETTYYGYLVHVDAVGNVSSVAATGSFTTTEASASAYQQILDLAADDGWAAVWDPGNPNTRTLVGNDVDIITDGLNNLSEMKAEGELKRATFVDNYFGEGMGALYSNDSASSGMLYQTQSDHTESNQPFAVMALLQTAITTANGLSSINQAVGFSNSDGSSSSGYISIRQTDYHTYCGSDLTGGGPLTTAPYVHCTLANGASSKIYINGATVATGDAGSRGSRVRAWIGNSPGNTSNRHWQGRIGPVLYHENPTEEIILRMDSLLRNLANIS